MGSINWFNQADNVERWAWYSLYTPSTDPTSLTSMSRIVNSDSEVLPIGRAMMNEGSPTTDCGAAP